MSTTPTTPTKKRTLAQVYFVRHGETDYNLAWRVQGQVDIPLNATGRAQAERVGARLARELAPGSLRVVASSPLVRAVDTAAAIARAYEAAHPGTAPVARCTRAGLTELSFGDLEGTVLKDVDVPPGNRARYAEFRRVAARWNADDLDLAVPHGESPRTVRTRSTAALMDVLNTYISDKAAEGDGAGAQPPAVVVVAHGRLLRTLMSGLLHVSCGEISLGNTAVSLLDWHGGDDFTPVYIADCSHAQEIVQPTFHSILKKAQEEDEKKEKEKEEK